MKRSTKFVCALLAAATAFTSIPSHAENEGVLGTVLGTIIGGVVGSQIGGGSGRTAATIAGAVLGGVVGQKIGKDLQEADRRAAEEAARRSFDRPIGERVEWSGSRYGSTSGAYGRVWTSREYRRNDMICRETVSEVYFRGRKESTTSTFCRDRYGNWSQWEETATTSRGSYRPTPAPVPAYPARHIHGLRCEYNGENYQVHRADNMMPIGIYGNGFHSFGDCMMAIDAAQNRMVCSWDGGQFVSYDVYTNAPGYGFGGDFSGCMSFTRGRHDHRR